MYIDVAFSDLIHMAWNWLCFVLLVSVVAFVVAQLAYVLNDMIGSKDRDPDDE